MGRSGTYKKLGSVRSFSPNPLPPSPLNIGETLSLALSAADRALARLDGATLTLPDPQMFVYAFMRQEALLSSQIEGTQASLEDLFEYEAAAQAVESESDVADVINYLKAMNWALKELETTPVSLRLIKEMHRRLLTKGRGAERAPGEFRRNQNWIGPPGSTIETASFVPPSVPIMEKAMHDLEKFIHARSSLPPLIRCALIHAQFETIHPFWDGNGRLGRMIVTLILCAEQILSKPVLYLSLFFKQNRDEYYARLQATRDDDDLEGWLLFFLRGVTATSRSALSSAQKILKLRQELIAQSSGLSRSARSLALIEILFRRPYITVSQAAQELSSTYPTANSLVLDFVKAGILREVTGGRRDRIFAFKPYLDLLHESADNLTALLDAQDHIVSQA